MDEETQFPRFTELLRKGVPSAYHEEIIHIQDLPIGIVIAIIGLVISWPFSYFSGVIPTIGLIVLLFGISLMINGFWKYFSLRKEYRFQNLSRKTISEAIMYLDARVFPPERLESHVPYDLALHPSFYNPEKFRNQFRSFVINTRGQITWPSRIVEQLKWDVEVAKQGLRPCSVTFFGLTIILIVIITYLVSLADWTWMFAIFLLGFCTLQGIWLYIKYLFDKKSLFRDSWIDELVSSNLVELKDSMYQIFNLLHAEFPYPLRFYLTGEYPQLVYTGREVISPNKTRLKEAVLYPKITEEKEESTGA
ncbi:MAG: hypothetical protein ACFFFK_01545 [Candidatus Thorarchaeota archaeon]